MKRKILLILLLSLTFNLFSSVEPDKEFKEGFAFLLLKNQEEAKKLLESWISRQKYSLLREAFQALLQGDKLLASSKFESFLNQDERNVEALLGYGLSLEEMYPSYQEFYFKQALKVNPNLSIGRLALGYNLINQEKLKDAEREIILALKKENLPVYKYFLFDLYIKSEEWEKAYKTYNEFFPSFPKDWSIPLKLGRLLVKKGIREKGIELLEKAYELNPTSTEILVEIGTTLTKDGITDRAITYFDKAYSINKNDPAVIKGRGIVLLEKGDFENALRELHKGWNKKKNDPEISFYLSKAFASLGKEVEAKEWLLRAIVDGFKDWKEIPKIPLFKDLTSKEKTLSFLEIISFPFYNAGKIDFLEDGAMVVLGKENKGEPLSIFIFSSEGKKLKKISLKEEIKDFFIFANSIFLRSSEKDETKQNIYVIGNNWIPVKINSQPIDFYEPFIYSSGNSFYIWDKEIEKAVRKSPFSLPISTTRRLSFYPNISFNLFQLAEDKSLKRVASKTLSNYEIPFINSCQLFENLYLNSKEFKKLVEKGKGLDISSLETIEIFPLPSKGAIVLDERGTELDVYMFDSNGKKLKEQKFKMDAVYSHNILDGDIQNLKFLSQSTSKTSHILLFDLKKKKIDKLVENVIKIEQTPWGYLILNATGELRELKNFSLKLIKKGIKDFYFKKDYLVFEGNDGWLYIFEGGKDKKVFPSSDSLIYNFRKEKGIIFSPQASAVFIKKF